EGQQHGLRPVGGDLDRQGVAHPRDGATDARWGRVGEHVQQVRPDHAIRWLQGIGLRTRGRHARPARLRPSRGPLMATRARKTSTPPRTATARAAATRAQNTAVTASASRVEVRKTYKLYIGG